MAPTKNKPPQPPKDFAKRPRAKVGKRAPAKLNATDTSFKTSSVSVRSQSTSLDKKKQDVTTAKHKSLVDKMELQSTRGNALSTLLSSLRHHAVAVRCSGLKGMRDAVQSLFKEEDLEVIHLGLAILESNLPSLVPNMCRCWLDEDGDVRNSALQLFGDLILHLSQSNGGTSHLKCLVPFVPFLCAYASSALNSLDRSIRKDGALLVGMMAGCTPYPSFLQLKEEHVHDSGSIELRAEVGKHVDLFLPPLERLLSSMSFGGRTKAKSGSGGRQADKKRKKDGNASTNNNTAESTSSFKSLGGADATILSLALLLKASSAGSNLLDSTDSVENNALEPSLRVHGECSFLQGGSAYANSILFFREVQRQSEASLKPINSIWDLPMMPVDDNTEAATHSGGESISPIELTSDTAPDGNLEKAQTLSTLVETLRIKIVELTQAGRKANADQKGIMLPVSDLDTLDAIIKALMFANRRGQIFHEMKMVDSSQLQKESNNNAHKRQKKSASKKPNSPQDMSSCLETYHSTITKTISLILENFPICSFDGKSTAPRYNMTNAELCSSLAELGGESFGSEESSSLWVDAVFSYILPRLAPDEHKLMTFGVDEGESGAVIEVLLKIARKLLLPSGVDESGLVYLLKSNPKRYELLQVFGDVFFPYKLVQGRGVESVTENGQGLWLKKFASTSAGRTASMLLTSLMSWLGDGSNHLDEKTCLFVMQMTSTLPIYLLSWQHQYPMETGKVLSSMLSVVRQWGTNSDQSSASNNYWDGALSKLCTGYQQSIGVMFRSSKSTKKQVQVDGNHTNSIFERSTEPIQKLIVGLLYILGSPSEELVGMISKICSRAFSPHPNPDEKVITTTMAIYIFEVLHLMRKKMQISVYLSFLINASGIEKAALPDDNSSDHVFFYDSSIQILCRFLVCLRDEVPAKTLPMIRPTLEKWLSAPTASNMNATKQFIRARAALSIVAAFTWDESNLSGMYQKVAHSTQSEFLKLDDSFDELLVDSMMNTVELLVTIDATKANQSDTDQKRVMSGLLGPITLLLCYRDGLMEKYLQQHSLRIARLSKDDGSSSWATVEVHMKTLLLVLKSKEPAAASVLIQSQANLRNLLVSLVESIEKTIAKSHLMHLSEKMSHEVNHIIRLSPA